MTSAALARTADHWSRVSQSPPTKLTRWWQHPLIVEHINHRICGEPLSGVVAADAKVIRGLSAQLRRGISVGCGAAQKEIELVRLGVVERFDLYEISAVRVQQGQALATSLGLRDRVTFRTDPHLFERPAPKYDLVYWNNSLHHMLDTATAVEWSRRVLLHGGVFYMNDYVGPRYMHFSEAMCRMGTDFRSALPERLMLGVHPRVVPADMGHLLATDPSECADSDNIIPAIQRAFPGATIKLTGGVIYHGALSDVLGNVTVEDEPLLRVALLLDDALADTGLTHYGVAYHRT